jgi:hypothetical protein
MTLIGTMFQKLTAVMIFAMLFQFAASATAQTEAGSTEATKSHGTRNADKESSAQMRARRPLYRSRTTDAVELEVTIEKHPYTGDISIHFRGKGAPAQIDAVLKNLRGLSSVSTGAASTASEEKACSVEPGPGVACP